MLLEFAVTALGLATLGLTKGSSDGTCGSKNGGISCLGSASGDCCSEYGYWYANFTDAQPQSILIRLPVEAPRITVGRVVSPHMALAASPAGGARLQAIQAPPRKFPRTVHAEDMRDTHVLDTPVEGAVRNTVTGK